MPRFVNRIRPVRTAALLQAALLVLTLAASPKLHWPTVGGGCAAMGSGSDRSCCSGCCDTGSGARARHDRSDGAKEGCRCPDDCCSWRAVFTAAPEPADTAPAVCVTPAPLPAPHDLPRAPHARLLPFSTGPPETV